MAQRGTDLKLKTVFSVFNHTKSFCRLVVGHNTVTRLLRHVISFSLFLSFGLLLFSPIQPLSVQRYEMLLLSGKYFLLSTIQQIPLLLARTSKSYAYNHVVYWKHIYIFWYDRKTIYIASFFPTWIHINSWKPQAWLTRKSTRPRTLHSKVNPAYGPGQRSIEGSELKPVK